MKCFVTGAAGYIGNALVHRLITDGHEVTGLLHHQQPIHTAKTVTYVTGDLLQKDTYSKYLKHIDIIFHCAAYVKDYGPKHRFHQINVTGTKQLAQAAQKTGITRFIYLGHKPYENVTDSPYTQSKQQSDQYLHDLYQKEEFPVVSIQPGNVFGPGPTTWVIRPLHAIQQNRIALIDNGNGIFHHTYIDNLLDALTQAMNTNGIEGHHIAITDGDTQISWKHYFNDLAEMIHRPPITKNITKKLMCHFMYDDAWKRKNCYYRSRKIKYHFLILVS